MTGIKLLLPINEFMCNASQCVFYIFGIECVTELLHRQTECKMSLKNVTQSEVQKTESGNASRVMPSAMKQLEGKAESSQRSFLVFALSCLCFNVSVHSSVKNL